MRIRTMLLVAVWLGIRPVFGFPEPITRSALSVSRCSPYTFPAVTDSVTVGVVGRGVLESAAVGPGDTEFARTGGHVPGDGGGMTYGQTVQVFAMGSHGASIVRSFADDTSNMIIVPWDYGPSCDPVQWTRSVHWAPTTSDGYFHVRLRKAEQWHHGVPVADAYFADHQPYFLGTAYQQRYGVDPSSDPQVMKPRDLLSLIDALPPHDAFLIDRIGTLHRMNEWERKNPDMAKLFPAASILAFYRREPPEPRCAPPPDWGRRLDPHERGEIRVRVRDTDTGEILRARHIRHSVVCDDRTEVTYSYTTGTQAEGWGPMFWLRPGRHAVELYEFPCGGQDVTAKDADEHWFTVSPGDTLEITIDISLSRAAIHPVADNPGARTCGDLLGRVSNREHS